MLTVATVKVKHLSQALVCVLGIYLLRSRPGYQLTPSWKIHWDHQSQSDHKRPAPVVTDLDGDGRSDVLIVTDDGWLQRRQYSVAVGGRTGILPELRVTQSEKLPGRLEGVMGQPVVMETGYLDKYTPQQQNRSQVIVVLFSCWYVVCYDDKLQILWQRTVTELGPSLLLSHSVQSMGLLVTPHTISGGDRGLVVLGGNLQHRAHTHGYPVDGGKEDGEFIDNQFSQFSTFALDGGNGTLRWKQIPGDSAKKMEKAEHIYHWKLSLHRSHWGKGYTHWTKFGSFFLSHLPHHWQSIQDTSFDLGELQKFNDKTEEPSAFVDLDLSPEHLIGRPYGGLRPHSRHEHVHHPDSLVVHSSDGIQILRLDTGQLLTILQLGDPTAVYADVNADGRLDEIKMTHSGRFQGKAATLHPRPKSIFAVNVCSKESSSEDTEDSQPQVSPVVVKSVSKPAGLLNHLMGRTLTDYITGLDSVFVTSGGILTSVNRVGTRNWQTQVSAVWTDQTRIYKNYKAFQPSMKVFSVQVYGPEQYAVVVGWDQVVLVNLADGYTESAHSLPCQPTDQPIIADFTDDGYNDVIIVCSLGYIGFSVQKVPQHLHLAVVSVTIVLVMLLLAWFCNPDPRHKQNK